MNALKISTPDEVTDVTLPKIDEIAILYPNDGKGFSISTAGSSDGFVRSENCQITRTFPTPPVGPADEIQYIGQPMSVVPSNVVDGSSFVFLGKKDKISILEFTNHTAVVDIVHGDLLGCPLVTLDATWLKYKGGNYNVRKFPWATLKNFSVTSDSDHGYPKTIEGNLSDCDLTIIENLKINNQPIVVNLENDFLNAESIVDLRLAGNDLVTGDISGLGSNITLTYLNLNTCRNVTGTLEGLLDAMHENGKTSGTMTVWLIESGVTYNGSVPARNLTVTFTSEGWTLV